jgi:hypothetical protein
VVAEGVGVNQPVTPWWQTVQIRSEIANSVGSIDDVQMSLFEAVYAAAGNRPPYADAGYYGEITHPSPNFTTLMANIAVRLAGGAEHTRAEALWWLDQTMGGGKSHGLIGLHHLATDPEAMGRTDIGDAALSQAADIVGRALPANLNNPRCVILAADNMTPGTGVREIDGPALTLHERFLWRLFDGDYNLFEQYRDHYSDKSKIIEALRACGRPVLILVDEIMNYIRQLSTSDLHDLGVKDMAFLRVLLDAVNDVPHVAMVVVMIRSGDDMELDAQGQGRRAELEQLLRRNGKTATVNDNTDFAAILRRRLFEAPASTDVVRATAELFAAHMTGPWKTRVFETLNARWTQDWHDEVARTYPFHPQLIALAEQEWANRSGFQRVRSTIRVFAAATYALAQRGMAGHWAPMLIGPGDLPLSSPVKEAILSSGLIIDSRVQANYRNIASTDIVTADDQAGAARLLDMDRTGTPYAVTNPRAAERAATALFIASVVGSRADGKQGASETELKAACFVPTSDFGLVDADAVIAELKDVDERGLAAVEAIAGKGGLPPRLFLSTTQTLNMLVRAARQTITDDDRDTEVAITAERLISEHYFKDPLFVEADLNLSARDALEAKGFDNARSTRLLVLDHRQFTLSNGADGDTRAAIRAAMGLGPGKMAVRWASSAVYAVANHRGRALARGAATEYLAWKRVAEMVDVRADEDLQLLAQEKVTDARRNFEKSVRRCYQNIFYLGIGEQEDQRVGHEIVFEQENQSALDGRAVWKALVAQEKAFDEAGFTSTALLFNLRDDDYGRPLDEVRDLFWSTPRMPLLPHGDSDLQGAIFEAVQQGKLRLVGADGEDREVNGPREVGVSQAGLRLAKPAQEDAGADTTNVRDPERTGTDASTTESSTRQGATDSDNAHANEETEVSLSGMISLREEKDRDALRMLLLKLADLVDEDSASYAQIMVKIRVRPVDATELTDLAEAAGTHPAVRAV